MPLSKKRGFCPSLNFCFPLADLFLWCVWIKNPTSYPVPSIFLIKLVEQPLIIAISVKLFERVPFYDIHEQPLPRMAAEKSSCTSPRIYRSSSAVMIIRYFMIKPPLIYSSSPNMRISFFFRSLPSSPLPEPGSDSSSRPNAGSLVFIPPHPCCSSQKLRTCSR